MTIFKNLEISAAGLTAQRQRLNVIAENLANAHTTRTPRGGPYLRKAVVLGARPDVDFATFINAPEKVEVVQVVENSQGLRPEHDPSHPDADENGMVLWPNVNPVLEMVSLMLASRAFEANVAVFRAGKAMALKTLEIGR